MSQEHPYGDYEADLESKGLKEKYDALIAARRKLLITSSGEYNEEFYDASTEFADKLQTKHEDYEDYYAYHVIAGGTPGVLHHFDFDGDDSVEKWLKKQQAKFATEDRERA